MLLFLVLCGEEWFCIYSLHQMCQRPVELKLFIKAIKSVGETLENSFQTGFKLYRVRTQVWV